MPLVKMEITAFLSGGILALAGRAVYDAVARTARSPSQTSAPPPPPPPPLPKKRPKVVLHTDGKPIVAEDLTMSYFGVGRTEVSAPMAIPDGTQCSGECVRTAASKSAPPSFVRDPKLVDLSRLKHVCHAERPRIPGRNDNDVCKQLEIGKSRLRSFAAAVAATDGNVTNAILKKDF